MTQPPPQQQARRPGSGSESRRRGRVALATMAMAGSLVTACSTPTGPSTEPSRHTYASTETVCGLVSARRLAAFMGSTPDALVVYDDRVGGAFLCQVSVRGTKDAAHEIFMNVRPENAVTADMMERMNNPKPDSRPLPSGIATSGHYSLVSAAFRLDCERKQYYGLIEFGGKYAGDRDLMLELSRGMVEQVAAMRQCGGLKKS